MMPVPPWASPRQPGTRCRPPPSLGLPLTVFLRPGSLSLYCALYTKETYSHSSLLETIQYMSIF